MNHLTQDPDSRAVANRANAQHSTGPKTEEGKNRSRFNAFRHGLTGKTIVMPWQDREAYEAFCRKILDGLKPEGPVEEQYAQTFADCSWRLNSAAAREANLFSLYVHERSFLVNAGDEESDNALAEAQALREESQVMANISLYCQRLARQRDNALEQLQKLQKERKHQLAEDLREAGRLRNLHTRKNIPYRPEEYGFVFSVPEIDAHLRLQALRDEARTPPRKIAA